MFRAFLGLMVFFCFSNLQDVEAPHGSTIFGRGVLRLTCFGGLLQHD